MFIADLLCLSLIAIILIMLFGGEGFRSPKEKEFLANQIILGGEPKMDKFRSLGVGGVEYYEAKKLWNRNQFNKTNVGNIL